MTDGTSRAARRRGASGRPFKFFRGSAPASARGYTPYRSRVVPKKNWCAGLSKVPLTVSSGLDTSLDWREPRCAPPPAERLLMSKLTLNTLAFTAVILISGCAENGEIGFKNHPVDCAMGFVHSDCQPGTSGYDQGVGAGLSDDEIKTLQNQQVTGMLGVMQQIQSQQQQQQAQQQIQSQEFMQESQQNYEAWHQRQQQNTGPVWTPPQVTPAPLAEAPTQTMPISQLSNGTTTFSGPAGQVLERASTNGSVTTFNGPAGQTLGTASTNGGVTTLTGPAGQVLERASTNEGVTTFTGPAGQTLGTASTNGGVTTLTGPAGQVLERASTNGGVTTFTGPAGQSLGTANGN